MAHISSGTFSYTEDSRMREAGIEPGDVVSTRIIGEDVIKRALYKYGFLNMSLLQKHLNTTGHKRIKGAKSVNKMVKNGDVRKYVLERGHNLSDISILTLSDSMVETLQSTIKGYREYNRSKDAGNIPYILENLSLAQYHMSALSNPKVTEQYYNHPVFLRDGRPVIIPSFLRFKSIMQRTIFLIGMPLPKSHVAADMAQFMSRLLLLKEYFMEKEETYRSVSFVIICDSDEQIQEMARLIQRMNDLKGLFIMYSRDSLWGGDEVVDPLKRLYKCDIISGRADMSLIRMK